MTVHRECGCDGARTAAHPPPALLGPPWPRRRRAWPAWPARGWPPSSPSPRRATPATPWSCCRCAAASTGCRRSRRSATPTTTGRGPTIGVPKSQVIAGDGMFGLHPALAPLLPLWTGRQPGRRARGRPAATRPARTSPRWRRWRRGRGRHLDAQRLAGPDARHDRGDRPAGRGLARQRDAGPAARPGPSRDVSMASVDGFTLAGDTANRPMAAALRSHVRRRARPAGRAGAGGRRGADRDRRDAGAPATHRRTARSIPATALGAALRDVARLIKARSGWPRPRSTPATGTCTRVWAPRSRASGCTTTCPTCRRRWPPSPPTSARTGWPGSPW